MARDGPEKFPDFFTIYFTEFSSERMHIPGSFVRCLKGVIPKKSVIRNNAGRCWDVEVKETREGAFFQRGWKLFWEENDIQNGEFLVFKFNGEVFDCRVFGISMCEKEFVAVKEEPEEDDSEEEEEQEDEDPDDYDYRVGEEADEDDDPDDEDDDPDDEETVNILSSNPSFEVSWRPSPRCKLRIPFEVIRDNNIVLNQLMIFQDPENREWPGKVSVWGDGSTWIGGWKLFCKKNGIKEGDKCVCELMLDNEGHQCRGYRCVHRCERIKVQIIRKIN